MKEKAILIAEKTSYLYLKICPMPLTTNFSIWVKNRQYQVEKFCNDFVSLIQYSISQGYNHVMNIFKDADGTWHSDIMQDDNLINEIGSAIEHYEE